MDVPPHLQRQLPSGSTFLALYREQRPSLEGFFRRQGNDPDVARDLATETFVVLLSRREHVDRLPTDEQVPWLFGVARNVLAHHRRAEATLSRALDRLPRDPAMGDDREAEETLSRVARPHVRALLSAALAELPEHQRDAVRLRVVDELPYPELAAQLGHADIQLARAWVSRGLRALAGSLAAAASANLL